MSWVGKMKLTMTKAGHQAKAAAEANRLKAQMELMQQEMERHFHQMGRLLFDARTGRMRELPEMHIRLCIERVLRLERDMEAANNHIASMQRMDKS